MVKRCSVAGCDGNGRKAASYTPMVKFPPKSDPDHEIWIQRMPNARAELEKKAVLHICASHFEGEWKIIKGGKRPVNSPSIFPGVPKSCFRPTPLKPRNTVATAQQRNMKQKQLKFDLDKIKNFKNFRTSLKAHAKDFVIKENGNDITMFMTNSSGSRVTKFIHFREIQS